MFKSVTLISFLFFILSAPISFTEVAAKDKKEIVEQLEDTSVVKDLNHLFFVGNNGTYTGIYKYDFETDDYGIFWSARNESVVKLLYSDDLQYVFFLTARSFGIKNGISYINNIKLYRLIPELSLVEYVTDIGDAIQVIAFWEGINFRIQFTSIDLRVATYINRTNQVYSPFGRLVQQTIDVFDYIKNGYPTFDAQPISLLSPSGRYGFVQREDVVNFKNMKNQKEFEIDTLKGIISNITWTPDENYAIITTFNGNDRENNPASELLMYNIHAHNTEQEWDSQDKINLIVTPTYLIYDRFDGERSTINIFDYKKMKNLQEITLRNGCGLTAVP